MSGQPHLLGVELRLHPAQHDVVDLAGVAQPEQGASLVGQQGQPQPLVVLVVGPFGDDRGVLVGRRRRVQGVDVLLVVDAHPLGHGGRDPEPVGDVGQRGQARLGGGPLGQGLFPRLGAVVG